MIDVCIHTHEHMADLKIITLYFKDSSPKEYVLWTSLYDIVEKTKPVYRGDKILPLTSSVMECASGAQTFL